MTWSRFLDPKNECAFRRIFGTDKNKEILIHFLNDLLSFHIGASIEKVTFLDPIPDPEIAIKKQSIVDVLCIDAKGAKYIIEMLVARIKGFEKRAHYYAAKAYSGQMRSGEDYDNLKEIIFLAVVDFVMFPNKENYHSDHIFLDRKTYEHELKDFAFCCLELPKFSAEIDQLRTPVERWAYFFKRAPETYAGDLDQIAGAQPMIKKAFEVLNRPWWSDEEFARYEQETKRELDYRSALGQKYDEGFAQGLKEGKERRLREEGERIAYHKLAMSLLKSGFSIGEVNRLTGLGPEELDALGDLPQQAEAGQRGSSQR
jgi:predicted transposase/invertase (TIGR01784 family)